MQEDPTQGDPPGSGGEGRPGPTNKPADGGDLAPGDPPGSGGNAPLPGDPPGSGGEEPTQP